MAAKKKAKKANPNAPMVLVCGEEDFAVKGRAKELYEKWCEELGGMDHEIVDATCDEAIDAYCESDCEATVGSSYQTIDTGVLLGG